MGQDKARRSKKKSLPQYTLTRGGPSSGLGWATARPIFSYIIL